MSRLTRPLALIVLSLGSMFLVVGHVLSEIGVKELAALREEVALSGGGFVLIRNPHDCSALAGPVEQLAARLQDQGAAVHGRVIRGAGIREALEVANRTFPHAEISPRATTALYALGHTNTPMGVGIDQFGKVRAVEAVDGRPIGVIPRSLIGRTEL